MIDLPIYPVVHKSNLYLNTNLAIIFIVLLQTFILPENLKSQITQKHLLGKVVSPENIDRWINLLDSTKGTEQGYSSIRNVVSYCFSQGSYAEAYFILYRYKDFYPNEPNFFILNMNNLDHFVAAVAPDSSKLFYLDKYIQIRSPHLYGLLALKRYYGFEVNQRNWAGVIKIVKRYKDLFPTYKEYLEDVIKLFSEPEKNVDIRNISPLINTNGAEWDPNPTPDGQQLYFSSSSRAGGLGGADVWVSQIKDGVWQKPENLGNIINGRNNETVDNVTADGSGLFLSGDFPSTFGNFDIYYVEKEGQSWGSLQHFHMPINSQYTDEGACLSSDGQVMIFTSDRPGGVGEFIPHGTRVFGSEMGNLDLYICFRTADGWTRPVNMGTTINTPFAERSPYLHPDGKTLYFSSEGHPGLGSLDVFKTTRLYDTSWAYWSKPVNLGKEINTISDDWGYKVVLSGDSAVFAALNRTIGYGDWDIFSVSLPDEVKPEKVATVKGKVLSANGDPLEATIKWEDLSTGKTIGQVKSNSKTGNYFIVLPLGKNYGYYAEKKGYYPLSQNVDLTETKSTRDIILDITLNTVEELIQGNKEIIINNIFFDYNRYDLKEESNSEIDRLYNFLKDKENIKIEISGHTDNIGTYRFNKNLSLQRAKAVTKELIKKGIDKSIIVVKGYADTKPIRDNVTEENRSVNRRVEFRIKKVNTKLKQKQ